jgi:hypothetical protein
VLRRYPYGVEHLSSCSKRVHEPHNLSNLYVKADLLQTARPWNERHSWQSWRDQYVKNSNHYDALIEKHIVANNLPRSMPQSAPRKRPESSSRATQLSHLSPLPPSQPSVQRQEDPQDVENLAQYFADKSTKEDARQHAVTFQAMLSDVRLILELASSCYTST